MLLTKEINIILNRGNIGYYNKKMCKKFSINEEITVPIDKIPKSMYVDVDVKCDICLSDNRITYRNYNDCLKYGFYSCQKCKHVKRKITNKEKYGNENFTNIEKRINTMNSNYGCYFNNKEKTKDTVIRKYGVENISQIDDIKLKKKNTTLLNFGVINPTYIQDSKFIYTYDGYFKYDIDRKLHIIECEKGHFYEINTNLFYSRYYRNHKMCTICNTVDKTSSMSENEIYEFIIDNYKGEVIQSYRDGFEIDIYIPEFKLGFEFNGLYWHSDEFKHKNYHLDKTKHFESKGIRIIHIWEDEWLFKKEIVKSIILNKLNLTINKIGARKCEVSILSDSMIVKKFLDDNHIQGYSINNKINLGLFHNGQLVSIMCFNNLEGRNKISNGYNLNRFCNKINYNIVGSASKLLKFFIKNYRTDFIISYADYSLSDGYIYYKLGFNLVNVGYPDYKYIVGGTRKNKSGFKKEKLGIKNEKITEKEYTDLIGLKRIWDCGKLKFKMII